MEILKTKKYLGIAGNALLIIGLFLPFISAPSAALNILAAFGVPTSFIASGVGILILILSLASLAIIFADKLADKVPALSKLDNQKYTLIPTAISGFIVLSNVFNALPNLKAGIGLGIGIWICIIGIVACAAYPFLYKGEN